MKRMLIRAYSRQLEYSWRIFAQTVADHSLVLIYVVILLGVWVWRY